MTPLGRYRGGATVLVLICIRMENGDLTRSSIYESKRLFVDIRVVMLKLNLLSSKQPTSHDTDS